MRRCTKPSRKPTNDPTVRPTLRDIVWTAGFYEGEGSCSKYNRRSPALYGAQAAVGQKNLWPLQWLKARFGGSIGRAHPERVMSPFGVPYDNSNWQLCGPRARGFLMTIFPLLSPRRQSQILASFQLCDVRLELPDAV